MALAATRPDVLIAANGDAVAVRTADGRLTALKLSGSAFTIRDWLAGDGDTRTPDDKALASGFACDETGCIARLADNSIVAVSRTAAALAEDCKTAALVITPREASPGCATKVLDRKVMRARGAMDIRRKGEGWQIEAAMPPGTDRPWARGSDAVKTAPAATTTRPAARNAPVRDATPRTEDLEADD